LEIFNFFLKSYRCKILDFCGSTVNVEYNKNSSDGLLSFREFDNGKFKDKIFSKHPNILKGVIIGKKSWGLFVNEWSDGIVDGLFTKYEILNEFKSRNIQIPESLLNDFENRIYNKRMKKYNSM